MQPYAPPPEIFEASPAVPMSPHSREAEEAVCGSVLINPEIYYEVREVVRSEDFYIHRLRWVMEAFHSLSERKVPIDMLTVADALEAAGNLGELGGPAYLTSLINQVPSSLNASYYAQIVKGMAARRKMIKAANEIAKSAYDTSSDISTAFSESERAWQEVRTQTFSEARSMDAKQMMSAFYDRMDTLAKLKRPPGIATCLDVDKFLHGLRKGKVYLVAGLTGSGKTAFLLSVAKNVCKHERKSVAFFSIEMQESTDDGDMISGGELSARLVAMESGVDGMAIADGRIDSNEWPLVTHAIEQVGSWRFVVDDDPNVTPEKMIARARRIKGEYGLDLVIVDYIQLEQTPEGMRFGTRNDEVTYLSRGLVRLAKELNVVVLAGAQVNRGAANRAEKRLQVSDLRESGSLEQDAFGVILLQPSDEIGLRPVEVAKHRGGPVGTCSLYFDAKCTEFRNGSRRVEEAEYWWTKNGNGHNGNGGGNGQYRR